MIKKWVAVAGVATVLSLTGCGSSADSSAKNNQFGLETPGTIQAAVSTDQPPFATAAKDGTPQGYIVDITNEVAKRLGLKVNYKATTVPAALQGLTSGQYDLAASGLGVTPEREKSVAFTKALYWSTTAVVTGTSTTATQLTEFKGKKVAVVTGAVQVSFVETKMTGAQKVQFPNQNAAVSQLLSGNVDAFVVGGPDAEAYLKQYNKLKIAVSAPVDHPTAMAVQKKNTSFQQAVNDQLTAMVNDGTFLRLYRKWFTEPPLADLVAAWPSLKNPLGS
jgi:polar amino acid transport system substrate-binding protein